MVLNHAEGAAEVFHPFHMGLGGSVNSFTLYLGCCFVCLFVVVVVVVVVIIIVFVVDICLFVCLFVCVWFFLISGGGGQFLTCDSCSPPLPIINGRSLRSIRSAETLHVHCRRHVISACHVTTRRNGRWELSP